MFKRVTGFFFIFCCSFPALASELGPCFDNQSACIQGCIASGEMSCVEHCGADAQMCLEKESQAASGKAGETVTSKRSSGLEGCWRSEAKMTTWCFTGNTSVITTDEYAGSGKRITELKIVSMSDASMTYYITRAAMTGSSAYDHVVNKGPYDQAYTYSNTKIPSFYAAGDQYIRQ